MTTASPQVLTQVLPRPAIVGRTALAPPRPRPLPAELVASSIWTDQAVLAAGLRVVDVPIVSVGGGIGSFALADILRIAGIGPENIRVLGMDDEPWQNYRYLTRVSQIPEHQRLRSDSSSTPDNLWAFPGYAIREAAARRGLGQRLAPLWQVLTEPILEDYYTPEAGQVFRAMARESGRIGYPQMLHRGQVRMVRRRHGGGYFTVFAPSAEHGPHSVPADDRGAGLIAYRSSHVHLALGYPGLKVLPDTQAYRERYGDQVRVVNAYEPHDHVYEELLRRPSTVLLRGAGIVASRVLQRIIDDRERHGAQTTVVHVFRTYVGGAHGPNLLMRRRGGGGWAYQGFNWPKATWGGQLKRRLESLEGEERKQLYDLMGGTTTARRDVWLRQLEDGRAAGFYKELVGTVDLGAPGPDGAVLATVQTATGPVEVNADAVIDSTGLEADIREHPVLADLLDYSGAGLNPLGRLDVDRHFEVRGARNGGRVYAAGAATLGGYFAPVDTFLGLQYAALQICDDLARQGFGRRIGVRRSVAGWWRWSRNVAPGGRG